MVARFSLNDLFELYFFPVYDVIEMSTLTESVMLFLEVSKYVLKKKEYIKLLLLSLET